MVAIIGPSGSGKSTFLTLYEFIRNSRQVDIFISIIKIVTNKKTNIMKIRQNVGMVFQHFHLFPHKTVLENLTYAPMKVKGVIETRSEKKALELLEKVGLIRKGK